MMTLSQGEDHEQWVEMPDAAVVPGDRVTVPVMGRVTHVLSDGRLVVSIRPCSVTVLRDHAMPLVRHRA